MERSFSYRNLFTIFVSCLYTFYFLFLIIFLCCICNPSGTLLVEVRLSFLLDGNEAISAHGKYLGV